MRLLHGGMYCHCENGGQMLGHLINDTQPEYVRIHYTDNSLCPVPARVDEEALVMLSDILPTDFECGVLNGEVNREIRFRLLVQAL